MKISLTKQAKNPYRSRGTGSLTFVYDVSGTPEELAAYKATKGEFYRENADTKAPLFFGQTFAGKECDMKANKKGNFYPEVDELTLLAEATALYGVEVAVLICTPKRTAVEAEVQA